MKMWDPSDSEIRCVVASEIESWRGNVDGLEDSLIDRQRLASERARSVQYWDWSMRGAENFRRYCDEVRRQVGAFLALGLDDSNGGAS